MSLIVFAIHLATYNAIFMKESLERVVKLNRREQKLSSRMGGGKTLKSINASQDFYCYHSIS